MVKHKFKLTPLKVGKQRKSLSIPNQSLTVKEIVKRFVKNLPIDGLSQKQQIYLDQADLDLEKLSRLDSTDKAFEATRYSEQSEYLANRLQTQEDERQRRTNEEAEKARHEQQREKRTGIDNLDNTMPVDTNLTNRQKGGKQNQ